MRKAGMLRDYIDPSEPGESRYDILGETVAKAIDFGIATHIVKRQHCENRSRPPFSCGMADTNIPSGIFFRSTIGFGMWLVF